VLIKARVLHLQKKAQIKTKVFPCPFSLTLTHALAFTIGVFAKIILIASLTTVHKFNATLGNAVVVETLQMMRSFANRQLQFAPILF
jgi:hypothetical protein